MPDEEDQGDAPEGASGGEQDASTGEVKEPECKQQGAESPSAEPGMEEDTASNTTEPERVDTPTARRKKPKRQEHRPGATRPKRETSSASPSPPSSSSSSSSSSDESEYSRRAFISATLRAAAIRSCHLVLSAVSMDLIFVVISTGDTPRSARCRRRVRRLLCNHTYRAPTHTSTEHKM